MMRGSLFIFVKAPRAGMVKTRLGEAIGHGRATSLFRHMTHQTISEASKGDWLTALAVDPKGAVNEIYRDWPDAIPRIGQGVGDLGDRMTRFLAAAPPGPVVIIGADAPAMRVRHLRTAFRALAGSDAVFGPAHDGGFWLIGLARRRPAPDLFAGVRWSTEHTLEDTLASLPRAFRVQKIDMLHDVDEASDLPSLKARSIA